MFIRRGKLETDKFRMEATDTSAACLWTETPGKVMKTSCRNHHRPEHSCIRQYQQLVRTGGQTCATLLSCFSFWGSQLKPGAELTRQSHSEVCSNNRTHTHPSSRSKVCKLRPMGHIRPVGCSNEQQSCKTCKFVVLITLFFPCNSFLNCLH